MRPLPLLVVVAALAACRSVPPMDDASTAIRGQIVGAESIPREAAVQVYRIDAAGLPSPEPFESVHPDRLGRFKTRALLPGRYRLAYRSGDAPPSLASARVPGETPIVMRPLVLPGLVGLRVAAASSEPTLCRLTEAKALDGVPDVREFRCSSRETTFVRGMRPGLWRVDLPELGATTEIDLPVGDAFRELVVDPPPIAAGATLVGEVRRIDGAPSPWVVVSARSLAGPGVAAARWGRYAVTDRAGHYRVIGIPPGEALVRVECREAPIRILPSPQAVAIPPTGTVQLGFVAEP
jgi:hypothetical protein